MFIVGERDFLVPKLILNPPIVFLQIGDFLLNTHNKKFNTKKAIVANYFSNFHEIPASLNY